MAALQILKGPNQGAVLSLDGDRIILGRNPDCGIIIALTSVSREHAQILRISGKHFIEDKQSRNGTFVNEQRIDSRTPLKNNDRIRICDFVASFQESARGYGEDYGTRTALRVRAVQPLTLAGGVNTPDYLSPQQIDEPPEGAVKSVADDLHAVAVLAFQMLTGRLPFPTTGSVVARLEAIVERRFDSAVDVCRVLDLKSALAGSIDHALAGKYRSAQDWIAQLPPLPRPRVNRLAAITRGEGFGVRRLLFEDVVSEAYEGFGLKSATRVTLRLFKPRFHSEGFLKVLAELPATGHDPAPEASPGILHRYLAGRARPLPIKIGCEVEIDPKLGSAGCPCLIEEYAGNQTLRDVIGSGAIRGDDQRVGALLVQLLETLSYAHSMNCPHGNLTPYCVFVHDDQLKVEGFRAAH